MVQAKKLEKRKNVNYYKPQPMNFVKLQAGQAYEGIFLGIENAVKGIAYSFSDPDSGEHFCMGGGRVELDRAFRELMGNPVDFHDQTLIGHRIEVGRLEQDVQSKSSGNQIHQYVIAHIKEGCPKGCGKLRNSGKQSK